MSWQALWDEGREVFVRKWKSFYDQKYRRAIVWHSPVASLSTWCTWDATVRLFAAPVFDAATSARFLRSTRDLRIAD